MDTENLSLEVKADEMTEEKGSHIAGRVVSNVADGGSLIGGGVSVTTGITRAALTTGEATSTAAEVATSSTLFAAGTTFKVIGAGLFVVGTIVGAGVGGYLTHKHCEEMIEKFADYYRKNAEKISSSYLLASNYFDNVH